MNDRAKTNLEKEKDARRILEAGIAAAMPSTILPKILKRRSVLMGRHIVNTSRYSAVRIVAFGKAGLSMATAFDSRIRARDGIIIIPSGIRAPKRTKFKIIQSTHPNPSHSSMVAARAILSYIRNCRKTDLVVFLVSGGGSALVALPDGITLEEKMHTNQVLLGSGADIGEVNCVRKHLSKIKGGRMTLDIPCDAIALLMSDVKSDDMSVIASGTTYCDKTTFAQAQRVIRKYKIQDRIPKSVLARLDLGARGAIAETPKMPAIRNFVIASNRDCLRAMKKEAVKLGYGVRTATIFGKVEKQAGTLVKIAPKKPCSCLIFGGETTVLVRGGGMGGRNQEIVLRMAGLLQRDMIVGSIGTDGIDGNTEFAGALIHTSSIDRDVIKRYLMSSNSNAYFERFGGLIRTGHTQTNLLDIGIMLC